jgi:tRNA U34 5-methylaminomethyl-2-thiouridine-forming methyltransferase MnmC
MISIQKLTLFTGTFSLTKRKQFFEDFEDEDAYDLIYFDAFGFRVQPELWSLEIFKKMFKAMKSGGVLVTYACRSSIKNAMLDAGFTIEKLPGAPGKREMLRAKKC